MKDEALRRAARLRLAEGRLPDSAPTQTFGGRSTGSTCALCDARIPSTEQEFETEFGQGSAPLHWHVACFRAWRAERTASATALPACAESREASSSARSAAVLPETEVGGNIAVHGGRSAH